MEINEVTLEPVGPENWRQTLQVAPEQRKWVADCNGILARAYAFRANRPRVCLICHQGQPVGMALYYDGPHAYYLSQFLIDARFQGQGLGRAALGKMLDSMRQEQRYDRVILYCLDENEPAKRFYAAAGFHWTGERDEDEIVLEKLL